MRRQSVSGFGLHRTKIQVGQFHFSGTISKERNMRIKFMIAGFLFALSGAMSPQTLLAADGAAPSATMDIDIKEIGLIVGGSSGKGVLHYQGKDYAFTMKGLRAGAIVGATKSHATGEVYGMTKLEDFEGGFTSASAGVAAGKGKDITRYENNKGMYFTLKSKTTGLALDAGLTGGEIKLIKK
jgi:hypothetical protein